MAYSDETKLHNELSSITHHVMRPVRPLLPHLLPFAICLLCIPILLTISGVAGWLVWRGIPVGWSEVVHFQYGDSVSPYANVELPPILYNQPYDVSCLLVLPATESNFALGNFMTSLRISNAYNETLITVRRPAVLVPSRPSYLKQLIMSGPSTVKLRVPLLSSWVAGTADVKAYLELGRYDAWRSLGNGHTRELSVLQATLEGTVKPTGVRSLLGHYPRVTTFLSSFIFFFFAIVVVMGVIFCTLGRSVSENQRKSSAQSDQNDDSGPDESILDPSSDDSKSKAWVSRTQHDLSFDSKAELASVRRRLLNLSTEEESSLDTSKATRGVKIEEDIPTQ